MHPRMLPEKFLVALSFAGEQRDFVRAIAEAIESELGSGSVFFDEWFEYYLAGAEADLKLQEIYGKKCTLAVVCISAHYGNKPWTQAEHEAIRARIIESRTPTSKLHRDSVMPIRVGDGDVDNIPFNTIILDVRSQTSTQAAELVIQRLRLIEPDLHIESTCDSANTLWPELSSIFDWHMANHSGARDAFATLLTDNPSWRYLPIHGSSGTGKSHITRQMLANTLQIPSLACGRFDFKGSTSMDDEVRAFVQDLDVPVPPASSLLNERLRDILDALIKREQPALVIFDTYEVAGKPQEDWIERELLTRLVRTPWLRVVIAGQRVPKSTGTVWSSVAREAVVAKPPPPTDWFNYGKQHKPELKLEDVETICRMAGEKAGLLAQLLGPDT